MLLFTVFSGNIICDYQTLNVVSNKGIQGIYQKLGHVNGQTSWNSSGIGLWFSHTHEGWFFGGIYIEYLGQDMAAVIVIGTGNNSCPYKVSDDQCTQQSFNTESLSKSHISLNNGFFIHFG